MVSALPAFPGWPLADAAMSAGVRRSAGLTEIVAASVPLKKAPPAFPARSNPAAWEVVVWVVLDYAN